MIKFFRHIRQRMIKENRVSKYLLYALGEIILVVIGILIAVQINDWNETRKANHTSKAYLQKMIIELENTKSRMKYLTSDPLGMVQGKYHSLEGSIAICDSLLKMSYSGLTGNAIPLILQTNFGQASLNIQQDAFEEVKSTGSLNSLGSEKLINTIKAYYARIARESDYTDENNLLIGRGRHILEDGLGRMQMDYHMDSTVFDIDNYPWLKDPSSEEYKDLQKGLYIANRWQEENRGKMMIIYNLSDSLIQMIKDELSSRTR